VAERAGAFIHSITSSARARSIGGNSMPSALYQIQRARTLAQLNYVHLAIHINQLYNLGRSAVIIQKMLRPSIRLRCELRCRSGASSPKMSRPLSLGGALSIRS
jgi:hypothetical protein